jgi:L,D-transpeptidase catalytic domain
MRVRQLSTFDVTALVAAGLMMLVLQHVPQTRFHSRVKLDLGPITEAARAPKLTSDRVVIDLAPPERIASPKLAPDQRDVAAARAERRLRQALTDDLLQHFKLFLYVSKAEQGVLAQHMFVFDRQAHDTLHLLYAWPVSTGREKIEWAPVGVQVSTYTPAGYYQLDRWRFYEQYRSRQWDEAMPHAMFFNWVDRGRKTGLAIHAAEGAGIAQLGSRASAGCVRLSPKNARTLFELIRSGYAGDVPEFAFDNRSGTMLNNGALMRDGHGALKMTKGYRVLVLIENTGGGGTVAAML